jgi:hypothetical protein
VGAVSQVQALLPRCRRHQNKTSRQDRPGRADGEDAYNYVPKSFLVAGHLKQFVQEHGVNEDRHRSFSCFGNTIRPEIITFDELHERVEVHSPACGDTGVVATIIVHASPTASGHRSCESRLSAQVVLCATRSETTGDFVPPVKRHQNHSALIRPRRGDPAAISQLVESVTGTISAASARRSASSE